MNFCFYRSLEGFVYSGCISSGEVKEGRYDF